MISLTVDNCVCVKIYLIQEIVMANTQNIPQNNVRLTIGNILAGVSTILIVQNQATY